jgi:hypothetical protein
MTCRRRENDALIIRSKREDAGAIRRVIKTFVNTFFTFTHYHKIYFKLYFNCKSLLQLDIEHSSKNVIIKTSISWAVFLAHSGLFYNSLFSGCSSLVFPLVLYFILNLGQYVSLHCAKTTKLISFCSPQFWSMKV